MAVVGCFLVFSHRRSVLGRFSYFRTSDEWTRGLPILKCSALVKGKQQMVTSELRVPLLTVILYDRATWNTGNVSVEYPLCVYICNLVIIVNSRESSVDIALGYGLDDLSSRVRFPAGAGNFSLHHRVQTGSGDNPASYPMGTRGSFPGGKAAGTRS
jgi:hypothetical protein